VEEDDSPLLVATTHLSVWFDDAESEIIRHKQTRELLRFLSFSSLIASVVLFFFLFLLAIALRHTVP
jgi:hypothetical protein